MAGPGGQGIDHKGPRVTKGIEHPFARTIAGYQLAIVALIGIEAPLLAFQQIDDKVKPILTHSQRCRRQLSK